MKRFRVAMLGLVCVAGLHAQTFEVALVKVNKMGSAGGEGSTRENIQVSPGSLTMKNVSLSSALQWAYGVRGFQISGPGWLTSERYDIAAKGAGSGQDLRLMLQALLKDRFKIGLRRESKDLPVYALVTTKKGSKLKASTGEGASRLSPEGGDLVFRNFTMPELAERLATIPFKLDRPVVDETGMDGRYDFHLKLASGDAELKSALEGMDRGVAIFAFFQEQLGLKLEGRKAPMELLVVERAEKVPVEN